MLNVIVAGAAAFASVMACRSEPAPLSFVFVTVNVAAETLAASNSDRKKTARTFLKSIESPAARGTAVCRPGAKLGQVRCTPVWLCCQRIKGPAHPRQAFAGVQCRVGRERVVQPVGSNGDMMLNAFVNDAESPFGFVTTTRGVPAGSGGSVSVIVCASTTTAPAAVVPSNVTVAPVTNPVPVMVMSPCPSVVEQTGAARVTDRPAA